MSRTRRLCGAIVAIAILVAAGACSDGGDEAITDPGFAGHWTSTQWGEHYVLVEASTVKIIYTHDDGRATGTLNGTTFTGWWTESPSRKPSADAGDVEFSLKGAGNERTIDGKWRYGSDGTQRENWDLVWVGSDIPSEIAAKFADPAMFVAHP